MAIFETYDALRRIAAVEFSDIILRADVLQLPSGDPLKLRLHLIDDSLIDIYLSVSGRYSYHWERRLAGKDEIYRHDNAPHHAWENVLTFPRHFHDGSEANVVASNLSPDPTIAIRQFCTFARHKLRQEAG